MRIRFRHRVPGDALRGRSGRHRLRAEIGA
jgi:hypothetical protein